MYRMFKGILKLSSCSAELPVLCLLFPDCGLGMSVIGRTVLVALIGITCLAVVNHFKSHKEIVEENQGDQENR